MTASAIAASTETAAQPGSGQERELVVFLLGGELYGVAIKQVREIIPLQAITRVPQTPEFILGVINLRGRVIPVIDLRSRLGLPVMERNPKQKIAVADLEQYTVGMLVDGVSEVLQVKEDQVEPPPSNLIGADSEHVIGVAKHQGRLIILLDLPNVLSRRD